MGSIRTSPPRRVPRTRRGTAAGRALARWAVVAALAVTLAAVVAATVGGAARERERWGRRHPVVVLTRPVADGAPVDGSVALESWPTSLVPDGAITSLADVAPGASATGPRSAGEVLTHDALAAPGTAAARPLVAVPTPGPRPTLAVGDGVAVWATVDPSLSGGTVETRRIAEATVAEVVEGSVVVAVDRDDVASVVEAAALTTVTLVSERR